MTSPKASPDLPALPRLLTVEQVAEYLQMSTRHIRRLLANGELAHVRIGRMVRIRPEAVEAMLVNVTETDSNGNK